MKTALLFVMGLIPSTSFNLFSALTPWRGQPAVPSISTFVERCPRGEVRYFKEAPVTLYRPTNNFVKFVETQPALLEPQFNDISVGEDKSVPQNEFGSYGPGVAFLPRDLNQEEIYDFLLYKRSRVTVLPKGTPIPEYLQLVNSCRKKYYLYPIESCTVVRYNKLINKFMRALHTIDRTQYFAESPFGVYLK